MSTILPQQNQEPDKPFASSRQMPAPPQLPWGWLLLLTVLTLGIFGIVWLILQCNWVQVVRGRSRAMPWAFAFAALFVFQFVAGIALAFLGPGVMHAPPVLVLRFVGAFGGAALWLTAIFVLRSELQQGPINIPLNGVMTFFFNILYFQYHFGEYTARSEDPSRSPGGEQHELIHLLDEFNDDRAKASFRESIYIAVIIWLALLAIVAYGPHYLFRQPRVITAIHPEEQHQTTLTELPPDLVRRLPRTRPTPNVAERNQQSQSPQPSPAPATPAPGTPTPPAPQPQQAQPQQQQPAPQPSPRPQQQPQLADAPHPNPAQNPTHPIFNMGGTAGDQIQRAARDAARGGEGGNYGNAPQQNGGANTGVTVLSDTQNVDFSRYIQRLLAEIRRNWIPLIPEECSPPLSKSGVTGVRFTINPDGSILAMQLDYSTHDDAINRAAWSSIKALGKADPLPPEFHGPNLVLRIEFDVNKGVR